jgi:hypothetical protein
MVVVARPSLDYPLMAGLSTRAGVESLPAMRKAGNRGRRGSSVAIAGLLAVTASMSVAGSASAHTTRFRTEVFVSGNLISLPIPGETEVITGGLSSQSRRCLRNRLITVYDAGGTARGTARSGGPGIATGGPGDWQASYSAGGSFPVGTYYATAARKRLADGSICKFGRSRNTAVEH